MNKGLIAPMQALTPVLSIRISERKLPLNRIFPKRHKKNKVVLNNRFEPPYFLFGAAGIFRPLIIFAPASGSNRNIQPRNDYFWLLMLEIWISRFRLCSSEIRVSVAVTPGISWILLFKSSIRCSLSRAYSLQSMVYGPVVK